MQKGTKFVLVCCGLIGAGLILTGAGYAAGGRVWGISVDTNGFYVNTPNGKSEQGIHKYIEDEKELDAFERMDIQLDYGKFEIVPSDHYGISYCVDSAYNLSVEVEEGCLKIAEQHRHSFGSSYLFTIGGTGNSSVTMFGGTALKEEYVKVYVPKESRFALVQIQNDYGDIAYQDIPADTLKIVTEDGNINCSNVAAKEMNLKSGYGDIEVNKSSSSTAEFQLEDGKVQLTDFSADEVAIDNDYGEVYLTNVSAAAGKLTVIMEDGTAELKECVVKDFDITNEYGDVIARNSSADTAYIRLSNGECVLDQFTVNTLDVSNDYGDVSLQLPENSAAYNMTLRTEYGEIEVDEIEVGSAYGAAGENGKSLHITCEDGDIYVNTGRK